MVISQAEAIKHIQRTLANCKAVQTKIFNKLLLDLCAGIFLQLRLLPVPYPSQR